MKQHKLSPRSEEGPEAFFYCRPREDGGSIMGLSVTGKSRSVHSRHLFLDGSFGAVTGRHAAI